MEKDNWIEKVLNSTNGMTAASPSDDLLSAIQQKLKPQKEVPPATIWLVAASIAVLVALNFALVKSKYNPKENNAAVYLDSTLNQSNQLY